MRFLVQNGGDLPSKETGIPRLRGVRMNEPVPASGQAVALVKARFAEAASAIERSFAQEPSFRSLCEDYRDCLTTLERLQGADPGSADARRQEYTELREELEKEIRDFLSRHEDGPTPR